MSSDFDREKVLARVKKMMTLANDAGASEGERENALRMAHATLAKYNLTMSEAEASGKKAEEARGAEHMTGQDYPWMRTTAHAVAKLFFCEYFYILIGGGKVKHFFVGRESNVFTAQGMTTYVIDSINREAQRTAKERTGNAGGTFWRSFCKGAAFAVYERCNSIREEAEEESAQDAKLERLTSATGTALVLASVYETERKANEEYISKNVGELRFTRSRQRNTAADAHAAGQEYGEKINLSKQIGGTKDDKKRLK
jgi:hypothetical protein